MIMICLFLDDSARLNVILADQKLFLKLLGNLQRKTLNGAKTKIIPISGRTGNIRKK